MKSKLSHRRLPIDNTCIDPSFAAKLAESTGFCEGTWLELQRK